MPKVSHDILECVARVFHFNTNELFPKWIVIRSQHCGGFAVTTLDSFRLQQAAMQTDDWQIAINLGSEHLLQLLESVPSKTDNPDTCTTGVPTLDADLAPAGALGDSSDACGT